MTAPSLLVVGVGNPDRGDDGIGPLVARRLAPLAPPGVSIIERPGDALALIDDWAGHDAVILIDAAAKVSTPGAIHRVDLREEVLPAGLTLSSTHAFGVAEAVGLANTLGLLPAHVIAFAIEGANFDPGAPISAEILASVPTLVTRVLAEIDRLTMRQPQTAPAGDNAHA